jgi:hypothetical protein
MPRPAKREKVSLDDDEQTRSVIPSPFDDGAYDTPEEVVAEKPKRGRKPKVEPEDKLAGIELDANGEMPKPVFVRAWICDARETNRCPGRRPENARGVDDGPPICDCGSTMSRHSWAPKKKLFSGI